MYIKDCRNYLSGELINIQKIIDDKIYTLTNTFKSLRKSSPRAKIYVLGYPFLFNRRYDANCSISEFIEPQEQEFLNTMTERLNHVIEKASLNSGVIFLSVTEAFSGHGICSEEEWINSFNSGESTIIELFHPNANGQRAYADVLRKVINGR